MSTGNKIFIGIVIVIIVALIVGFMFSRSITDTEQNAVNTVNKQDSMFNLYGSAIQNDTNVEEETNTTGDVINSNYIGQEETPINNEVTETNEEKIVRLVKEKYGTTDGVSFNIVHQDKENEQIYRVSVNDSQTSEVLAWYTVNTQTWHVLEN